VTAIRDAQRDVQIVSSIASQGRGLPSRRFWWTGSLAAAAWFAAAGITQLWPDADDWPRTDQFADLLAAVAVAILLAAVLESVGGWRFPRLRHAGPWLVALPVILAAWEIVQAKLMLLPRPFFGVPQQLLDVYLEDWRRLGDSLVHSLALLATGYLFGAVSGFLVGLGLGWSRRFGYWAHPVIRLVGPLPSVALLPLAFILIPSSWGASNFLIALASGFPVAVLTWSGVGSVNKDYYDVARTLGASSHFLVWRVAVPAAMPSVFVGLFMGLGASFSVLVVAEMLGVKSGLGWYLQWAQGWAAYANMYAALIVMAVMCTSLITLLFKLRDRLLGWQKGTVKW
jgi:NitT/TauT family transport system permease protein